MNKNQRYVVETIVNAIENNKFDLSDIFFLNDSNGTEKIFVQNIVISNLRSQQKIVLTIASFDIAATFFDGDQTVHVRFKISLNFDIQSICDINKNTNRTTLIKKTKLIF